ncbi:enediyne biosynthesis protein UnbU [Tautonia marina]|uniref:enediyne biosynthesis protein UnbU n=1 Tax=Tautonia marina TaxID=2653855 RepID=UPI0012611CAD|nr:enediyne biosynthesis protein UnbU [Tautonia marina]
MISESAMTSESARRDEPTTIEGAPRYSKGHLGALRRFAVAITVLNVLGHLWLGFEQSWAQPLVALATAYAMQLLLETLDAWAEGRRPRYAGGVVPLIDSLLAAHIAAMALSMLLYYNDRLWVVAFAVSVAIASKYVLRVPVGSRMRHFLNPSNFAITVTLLTFPWVGLAMPWQFTGALDGWADWSLPVIIFSLGSLLNLKYTKRYPLIVAWLVGFVLQAAIRSAFFDASLLAGLAPATGVAALLFTFYMISDPATTPSRPGDQIVFGASVAAVYGVFMMAHVAFGLFYALTLVSAARGVGLYAMTLAERRVAEPGPLAGVEPASLG